MHMHLNPILNTDSYKLSHWKQYPPGTRFVSSYIESRHGSDLSQEVVFFGIMPFICEYTKSPSMEDILEAEHIAQKHGVPFNKEGWLKLIDRYPENLPLEIEALEEGTIVPRGVPQVQINNTDEEFPWLTSYVETALLRSIWYPSTVATLSREIKKVIKVHLELSGDMTSLPFMLHDFGARGSTSYESSCLAGMAHLINFKGTDTIGSLSALHSIYNYKTENFPGFSVPAAEHSTITSWGPEGEVDAYRNMIDQFGGSGKIYSVVSDSYDYMNAIENIWGEELRDEVLVKGGRLVIRPDSGHPPTVVLASLKVLGEKFGFTVNDKGYKILLPNVRVLQGDGIDKEMIDTILSTIVSHGWAADNVLFGMGGALHSKVHRDTLNYAMKCNAIVKKGRPGWTDVWKKPKTDGSKASFAGRQKVIPDRSGRLYSVKDDSFTDENNRLQCIYYNGMIADIPNWERVVKNAEL